MADLIRPSNISDASWVSLQALNATDPAAAQSIAARAGVASNPDAYVAGAIEARYRSLTSAGSGLNATRFASAAPVIPFPTRYDASGMGLVRELSPAGVRTEDRARDMDFRLIGGLMGEAKVG